jgi:hypothetical protein
MLKGARVARVLRSWVAERRSGSGFVESACLLQQLHEEGIDRFQPLAGGGRVCVMVEREEEWIEQEQPCIAD